VNELGATKMHAKLARLEVEESQQRLNAKMNRKSAKATVTSALGWLTSVCGKELHQEQEAIRQEKKCKKDEAAVKKTQEEEEKQRHHEDISTSDAVVFSGALSSKKVGELQDIVYALGLKDDGTKAHLVSFIKAHLNARQDLRDKPQFAGLFPGARGSKQPNNENDIPSRTRQ
jgi:hypothetical protein